MDLLQNSPPNPCFHRRWVMGVIPKGPACVRIFALFRVAMLKCHVCRSRSRPIAHYSHLCFPLRPRVGGGGVPKCPEMHRIRVVPRIAAERQKLPEERNHRNDRSSNCLCPAPAASVVLHPLGQGGGEVEMGERTPQLKLSREGARPVSPVSPQMIAIKMLKRRFRCLERRQNASLPQAEAASSPKP